MNYIVADLPAINLDATYDFYRMPGFQSIYQSNQGMILNRGRLSLEFFHQPELGLKSSWHSGCYVAFNSI
ncbi:hypothetical protein [Acinetobacter terrestris]|uniref:hypothetical protein n=1 Tax=Acinetobacter terrestris TaxID=2529843 RepID=UPI00103E9B9C|nr:hypothetical protein [Acinetobacter terrestris]TCB57086.1 hypothetical protein E0H84_02390 [Acinetobacter terrestris]